ncbi:undecaprenyl-diphosphate phosphatase [Alicyclobacillus vulcanalis]|uniref:Undecaprenyl-diphosphatase n=1 Tax=Alicyclobacillus vulcanalis TaxID=252246 RepID=A0A1N7NE09_9BACL|nr:undecaprenyl-diphosphate phosphatase [Alicyclobacillus vulcanalis]SIS96643.1 undecaprenyl-diphosphatase [Alicyclobacillus vulcanalis]
MTYGEAVLFGAVQGLTEFLPISSSGHIVLLQKLMHVDVENNTAFVLMLHLGTLFAVLYAMRKEVRWLIQHPKARETWMVVLALLPTAVIGALFEEWFDDLFASGVTIGLEFFLTGVILWWMDAADAGHKNESTMTAADSLWIGALQGVAILPALSRSGLTIAGGLWRGLGREAATRFSFLLSIPAILGGVLVKLDDLFEAHGSAAVSAGPMFAGMLAALVMGYASVRFTQRLVVRARMRWFAVYTFALAAWILFDQLVQHRWFPPLA